MAPLHKDLTNPDYVAHLEFLRQSESWSRDQIRDFELAELRRVLTFAYNHTAGYRKLFDESGVKASDIERAEDLRNFPLITKEDIRDNLEAFSADVPARFYVTTGGSSGIPMGMYRDKTAFAKELASKAHQYHRIGWREGDRQMVIRGLSIDTADKTEFALDLNELRCSTYEFVPETLAYYVEKAGDYQPEWLRCYPSAGYILASFIQENRLAFPKLKGVLCASEMLFEFQKDLMAEVFQTRIFSHYGHYELAALAGYCELTDDYHVLPQYGYVELIDDEGKSVTEPGRAGEIVATSFITTATPFIRYRTGDIAVLKGWGCESCGRQYQIWEKVVGRRQEMIVSKTGRMLSMTMLNMHDDIYEHLRQYQFFQQTAGKIEFRFVPKERLSSENVVEIKHRLLARIGEGFELEMVEVPQILLTKRGKHRSLVQMLELKSDNIELKNAQ